MVSSVLIVFVYGIEVWTSASVNYRLLLSSTHDHEDHVRYWLTDAVEDHIRYWLTDALGGGQPIHVPDKVFMVMSTPNSKVYYCLLNYQEFPSQRLTQL